MTHYFVTLSFVFLFVIHYSALIFFSCNTILHLSLNTNLNSLKDHKMIFTCIHVSKFASLINVLSESLYRVYICPDPLRCRITHGEMRQLFSVDEVMPQTYSWIL